MSPWISGKGGYLLRRGDQPPGSQRLTSADLINDTQEPHEAGKIKNEENMKRESGKDATNPHFTVWLSLSQYFLCPVPLRICNKNKSS